MSYKIPIELQIQKKLVLSFNNGKREIINKLPKTKLLGKTFPKTVVLVYYYWIILANEIVQGVAKKECLFQT